jgi:F0F1-type ATP synthase gamma subunit
MPIPLRSAADIADAGFHRTRQSGIDEELFDVIAGFDAMAPHG